MSRDEKIRSIASLLWDSTLCTVKNGDNAKLLATQIVDNLESGKVYEPYDPLMYEG
jgi:hypothetical protein